MLTLMKGDKGVELIQKFTNLFLLFIARNKKIFLQEVIGNKIRHHGRSLCATQKDRPHNPLIVNCIFPELQIIICHSWFKYIENVRNDAISYRIFYKTSMCKIFAFIAFECNVTHFKNIVS